MKLVHCDCDSWKEGIERIARTEELAYLRGVIGIPKDVLIFYFCPWCGRRLNYKDGEQPAKTDTPPVFPTILVITAITAIFLAGCSSTDNTVKTSALGVEYSKRAPKEVIVQDTYEVTSEVKSKHAPNITVEEFTPKEK